MTQSVKSCSEWPQELTKLSIEMVNLIPCWPVQSQSSLAVEKAKKKRTHWAVQSSTDKPPTDKSESNCLISSSFTNSIIIGYIKRMGYG